MNLTIVPQEPIQITIVEPDETNVVVNGGDVIELTVIPSLTIGGGAAPPTYAESVTGTSHQITASPTTGNVVLSFPNDVIFPYQVQVTDLLTAYDANIQNDLSVAGILSADVSGDLDGTLPSPTVEGIHGTPLQSGNPTNDDLIQYHATGSPQWRYRSFSQMGVPTLSGINSFTNINTFTNIVSLLGGTAVVGSLDVTSANITGLSSADIVDWYTEGTNPASKTTFRDDFIHTGGTESGEVGAGGWQYSGMSISGIDAPSGRPGIININRTSSTGVFYLGTTSVAGIAHTDDIEYVCFIWKDGEYDNTSARAIGLTDSPSSPTKFIGLTKDTFSYDWYATWYDSTPIGTTPVFSHTSDTTTYHKLELEKTAANTWEIILDGSLITTVDSTETPPIGALTPVVRFQGGSTMTCQLDFYSMRIGATPR